MKTVDSNILTRKTFPFQRLITYCYLESGDRRQGQAFSIDMSRLSLGKGFSSDVMWTVSRQPHDYGWSLHKLPMMIVNIARTALAE